MTILSKDHINAVRNSKRSVEGEIKRLEAEAPSEERDRLLDHYRAHLAEMQGLEEDHTTALQERGLAVH